MEISPRAEEILESLWIRSQEQKQESTRPENLGMRRNNLLAEELLDKGLVTLSEDRVELTERGLKEAEDVVRRHRLAERLLVDVLDVEIGLVEEAACRFEHLLQKGIDDSICTLLGHPKLCPHGRPVPKGRCCREDRERVERIVAPLSAFHPGQSGKIAYIHTRIRERLQKLMVMGVLPGESITLIQRFPSYIFQVGQTQIAVDEEIAESIYVRRAS
ncbi:MAG: DtxR family iron (metal) dependent repressor [Nitrososphaeria archaeon]|nr:DtxR family iron (metal) dependent repressor [Nitrososphaeria archaeon]NIN52514.1 DtxR family iron (metal) dependent repressor [Nitrososphaeria archaeon]NIQ34213.1 DtxR family iron (metal) dependent repressor [Nitrososphaeria archaeon]